MKLSTYFFVFTTTVLFTFAVIRYGNRDLYNRAKDISTLTKYSKLALSVLQTLTPLMLLFAYSAIKVWRYEFSVALWLSFFATTAIVQLLAIKSTLKQLSFTGCVWLLCFTALIVFVDKKYWVKLNDSLIFQLVIKFYCIVIACTSDYFKRIATFTTDLLKKVHVSQKLNNNLIDQS